MRVLTCLIAASIFSSCDKEKYFGGPNSFEDDFESYAHIDSTLIGDDLNWSHFQNTVEGNGSAIDTTISHSGNQSILFFASESNDNGASKASIVKQKMAFYEGDIVRAEMWYYIVGTEKLDWLFLFDFEEQTAIGAGPGMRLALVDDHLRVEHKYNERDIIQTAGSELTVPRNTWFKINFETRLSQKDKGYVKVWQNDTLIIEKNNHATLPHDMLYFQQGTKGMYTSIEFGITANAHEDLSSPLNLYLDDVSIKVLN